MTKQSCRAGEAKSWKETLLLPLWDSCDDVQINLHQQPGMRSEAARNSAIDRVPRRPLTICEWVWHQPERPRDYRLPALLEKSRKHLERIGFKFRVLA